MSQPDEKKLAELQSLYDQGRYLTAYRTAEGLPLLRDWTGEAAVLAGRLAGQLGGDRLGTSIHLRAGRRWPDLPRVRYYYARAILFQQGPLAAWELLGKTGRELTDLPSLQADWLTLHGHVLGRLRDFRRARQWIEEGAAVCPDSPWRHVELAGLLTLEDRRDEALERLQQAREQHPWYHGILRMTIHMLIDTGRFEEAEELIEQALERVEACWLISLHGSLLSDMNRYEEAEATYRRFLELAPLADKDVHQRLNGVLSSLARRRGDLEEARRRAEMAGGFFHKRVAENLKAVQEPVRKALEVPFVRQHHATCAPATLAAISRYWEVPGDHLAIAEAICYDGTPAHLERRWCEECGFAVREFTPTWETTIALVDRGIPYTLTTVETESAHLQAVVGYDTARGTLLVQDPNFRGHSEFLAAEAFERYRSTGPRGMAIAGREKADVLDGLDLPDSSLYDLYHRLHTALEAHDRERAEELRHQMEKAAPEHRLTLNAGLSLATYDRDEGRTLAMTDRLLKLFPDDEKLELSRLGVSLELEDRETRLARLEALCDKPRHNPVFSRLLAVELGEDARRHDEAESLLRRAIRLRETDALALHALGVLNHSRGRFEAALELFRFASCLDPHDEQLAENYFQAAYQMGREDEALAYLWERRERLGARSGLPIRTLVWAHLRLNRLPQALELLETALAERPEDGPLLLFAAEQSSFMGRTEEAEQRLHQARKLVSKSQWQRAKARLAAARGELRKALESWREVLAIEPQAIDAHDRVASLLAQTEDSTRAVAHLEQAVAAFPHNVPLRGLLIDYFKEESRLKDAIRVTRELLELHPRNAWARRELGLLLARERLFDEALAELEVARELEPESPSLANVEARVRFLAQDQEGARGACREALSHQVNDGSTIGLLLAVCQSRQQRTEQLAFVREEMLRQARIGEALEAYRGAAAEVLDPEELLSHHRLFLTERPDVLQAWSGVVRQLLDMRRNEEALELAIEATRRFPLAPEPWLDLAVVHHSLAHSLHGPEEATEKELEALIEAHRLAPASGESARRLAQAYQERGRLQEARTLLEESLARFPLDAVTLGYLAEVLWELGEAQPALERLQRAILLEPSYGWAWEAMRRWAPLCGRGDLPERLARGLTLQRGGEVRSWLNLAECQSGPGRLGDRLQALERALHLMPTHVGTHLRIVEALLEARCFAEALAACEPPQFAGETPFELRSRRAWVLAERGDLEQACGCLLQLLEEEPEFVDGWVALALWTARLQEWASTRDAAARIVQLVPHSPTGYALRGRARLELGERAPARTDLELALSLEPAHGPSATALLDLLLEDGDLSAVRKSLDLLRPHQDPGTIGYASLRLALVEGDVEAIAAGLAALCRLAGGSQPALYEALERLHEGGRLELGLQVLQEQVDAPDCTPELVEVWMDVAVRTGNWDNCLTLLSGLEARPVLWSRAASVVVGALGEHRQGARLVRFLGRNRERCKADDWLWANVGHALLNVSERSAAIDWLSDFEERREVPMWAAWNLVAALLEQGKEMRACQVATVAMERLEPDAAAPSLEALLAAHAALEQRWTEAETLLARLEPDTLRPLDRFLADVAAALMEEPARGWELLEEATARLHDWKEVVVCRRLHRRAAFALARREGGLLARGRALLKTVLT